MSNKFLVFSGTISYGLYLLGKLPNDAAKSFHLDRSPLLAFSMSILATFAIAALSWNLLEKPFLKLKRFFHVGPVEVRPIASWPTIGTKASGMDGRNVSTKNDFRKQFVVWTWITS